MSLLIAGVYPASALTIVRTTDASVSANLSASDVILANAAFDYAAAQIAALYSDPIQINITMKAVAGTGRWGRAPRHSGDSLLMRRSRPTLPMTRPWATPMILRPSAI